MAAVSGLFCEAVSDGSNAPPPPPPPPPGGGQGWYGNVSKGNVSSRDWRQEEEKEWAQPSSGGAGMEDLESMMLLESAAASAPDQSLMRWLLGESDDPKDVPASSPLPQMESSFPDPGSFAFSTGIESMAPLTSPFHPHSHPHSHSQSPAYSALPPPLPRHQFSDISATIPPLTMPFNPFQPQEPQQTVMQGVFSNPNSMLFSNNPNPVNAPNNVFFPVSYEMSMSKQMPLQLRPPPLWQNQQNHQNQHPVKQEFMFKPQQQQHVDLLQSLQRRPPLLPPQFHRQKPGPTGGPMAAPPFMKSIALGSEEAAQTMVGQLLKAAEAVEQGTFTHAQAILARLNQHLTPYGKPLHRAAYYFKEALASRILNQTTGTNNSVFPSLPLSPVEIVHKISAYKSFSEVSPLAQFANFTANQALLEALEGADAIHIIDFEIGLGGQWASFLQELALKMGGSPSLRLTALGARDSVEMHLARENLAHFAKELNISFEFNVLESEGFETLTIPMLRIREGEAVAVNMSVGMHRLFSSFSSQDSFAAFLKEISPKAVVVLDGEMCPSSSSFVQKFVEALQFYSFLFDSLDAVNNMNMEAVYKIEKFLLAPKIENLVVSGSTPAKAAVPPWRSVFMAGGLAPVAFSNFTETQAEYLIRRLPGRGFDVIKDQLTLRLAWQGRTLVSASLWRC